MNMAYSNVVCTLNVTVQYIPSSHKLVTGLWGWSLMKALIPQMHTNSRPDLTHHKVIWFSCFCPSVFFLNYRRLSILIKTHCETLKHNINIIVCVCVWAWASGGGCVTILSMCSVTYLHGFNFVSTFFVTSLVLRTCIYVFTCLQMCIKMDYGIYQYMFFSIY